MIMKNFKLKATMAVSLTLALVSICLGGCAGNDEYKGKPIEKITYTVIDYMGGYTDVHVIDFLSNTYSACGYLPAEEQSGCLTEIKSTFTDEQEIAFLNSAYKAGFFKLEGEYKPNEVILDGGGWKLEILYTDGTKKAATGDNMWPQELQDSANSFEELCGVKVV